MTDAERKAKEKYAKTVKNVSMQFKTSDPFYIAITDKSSDYKTTLSAVSKAMVKYCIENNIDISSYLWYFQDTCFF